MSANVFANGREVSAKKSSDQSIAAMPDVCLSPPSPPAGPLPIPYPNFSNSSDTSDGTKTVKIAGDEAGMKNQSNYKTSKGDEAATRNFGMGVVTHTIQGKTQFAAWSFDVMFEGANAVRFGDMTTHNHSSDLANPPSVTVSTGRVDVGVVVDQKCVELAKENEKARDTKVDKSFTGGYTLTTAYSTPPGGVQQLQMAVSSPKCLKNQNDKAFAPPNSKKTMGCSPTEYGAASPRHSAVNNNMARNHAEPKLMEPMFTAAGSPTAPGAPGSIGSLMMKTYHKDKGGSVDSMPCETCRPAICTAVACGLDITLCNEKNEAKKPPCNNGQPAPKADWAAAGLASY
jgi:hypothetical protein